VIVKARETKITKGKEKKDENQKRGLIHFGKVKKVERSPVKKAMDQEMKRCWKKLWRM
jgi:hypothetical protein